VSKLEAGWCHYWKSQWWDSSTQGHANFELLLVNAVSFCLYVKHGPSKHRLSDLMSMCALRCLTTSDR